MFIVSLRRDCAGCQGLTHLDLLAVDDIDATRQLAATVHLLTAKGVDSSIVGCNTVTQTLDAVAKRTDLDGIDADFAIGLLLAVPGVACEMLLLPMPCCYLGRNRK